MRIPEAAKAEALSVCESCGGNFRPSSLGQKFCTTRCAKRAYRNRRAGTREGGGAATPTTSLDSRHCAWCEEVFTPSDSLQMYCRKSHQKKAALRRKRVSEGYWRCPRPDKMAHESRGPADLRIAKLELKGMDDDLEPYLCRCGKWHIGHPTDSSES